MDFFSRQTRVCTGLVILASVFSLTGCGGSNTSAERHESLLDDVSAGYYDTGLGGALAVGFYSSGKVRYAERFADAGPGYLKLFQPRNRGWATRSLINVITGAAAVVAQQYPNGDRVQIGDASSELGGYVSGHASHQNGLDVDLNYLHTNRREMSGRTTSGFDEVFVSGGKITKNFDLERNWALLRAIVASGKVSRIFVDPAIKKAMCVYRAQAGAREVLRRLSPYKNHANHSHVRIKCPTNSTACKNQGEVSTSDGCSSTGLSAMEDIPMDEHGDHEE